MNNDLQAIMARRRRLAEGGGDASDTKKSTPPPPPPPPPPASKDKLSEIMARRRRLADGDEADDREMSLEELEKDARPVPSHNSSLYGSQNLHLSKGDNLQAIMERRRRLADGEATAEDLAGSRSSFPISPMATLPSNRRDSSSSALAYVPQGLSSPSRNALNYTSSPRRLAEGERPSAVASPVKTDLKSFSMSNDLKAIMDRRRKIAAGEMDDEDPPMAVQDEDPPMAVPSVESLGDSAKTGDSATGTDASSGEAPTLTQALDKESGHSIAELDVTSTHTHLKQSMHEKEPVIDVEDTSDGDSSSEKDRKIPIPATEERKPRVSPSQSSRRGKDELASSSHSKSGRPSSKERNRGLSASERENRKLTASSLLDDGARQSEGGAARTLSPGVTTKKKNIFDSDSDSSSIEEQQPIQKSLDSPAAAVMGSPLNDAPEVAVDEEAELEEVERFAAALEQGEPSGKTVRSSSTTGERSGATDTVSDLPVSNLKDKLASGRKRAERRNVEEASVDPSIDSRASTGSGGVGRRPGGRRSSLNEPPARKGSTSSSENRRQSTNAPTSDERRRKPNAKGRRSSNLERSRSDESRSSTEGGRTGRRRILETEPQQEESILPEKHDKTRKNHIPGEAFTASAFSTKQTTEGDEQTSKKDGFAEGDWGVTAFGESGSGNDSVVPSTSEHSELPVAKPNGTEAFSGDAFASEEALPSSGTDSAFPALSGDGFPSSSDAFSGAFMADFGDTAAFQSSSEQGEKLSFSKDAFGGFNDTFGAFDDANAFAAAGPDAFEKDNFSAPPKKADISYESSPLTGVPSRSQPVPSIYQKTVLKGHIQGSISTNSLNGNLIMCMGTGDGPVLREVDPFRHYVQILAIPLFSPELQRKVTSKFNVTALSVESVLQLSSGLHYEQGQTRLRVGVIMDLKVLEAPQPLRLVVIWLWGQAGVHPISIQYSLSPPSGADFTYDAKTLRMADNLIFLAGTSPKGPCVFVSKPSLRESWTANSLPGSGEVSSIEATPHVDRNLPYLAIGLTDRSVSIWTYREAIESSAMKGKESGPKRWLFPLCRLESTKTLSGIDATSLDPTGTNTGIGKLRGRSFCYALATFLTPHELCRRLKELWTLYAFCLASETPLHVFPYSFGSILPERACNIPYRPSCKQRRERCLSTAGTNVFNDNGPNTSALAHGCKTMARET